MNDIRDKLRRRAVRLEIGGFKPSESIHASWFGKINVGIPGETWPEDESGKPMLPICQVNLTEMPFLPETLRDIQFLALFLSQDELPMDDPNGTKWCLRTYPSIEALTPIDSPSVESPIKPFPMRPDVIEEDFPCWEDVPCDLPEDVDDNYYDLFENQSGFKLGGWPTLIQAEIFWAPGNNHPANPEYVFQIDSCEKANWMWGDAGVAYFGRGTTEGHRNDWTMAWQCY